MKSETTGKSAKQGSVTLARVVRHPVVKAFGVVAVALTLANCSSGKSAFNKYGVKASPRVIAEGQPVPKGGGRFQVGKPYVVAGRTYVPQENPGYSQVGLASWYGSDFHGRLTANGEIFDRHAVAAAHPTMPLPSYARVTNLANNRSMIVRVNDRGPYHADRVMDVSQSVAEALDFKRSGTAKIKVDYVGKASVNGSDDNILMASLRTDGVPAQLQRVQPHAPAPTMIAAAQPLHMTQSPVQQPRPMPQQNVSAPVMTAPNIHQGTPVFDAPLPPQRPYIMGQVNNRKQMASLARGDED